MKYRIIALVIDTVFIAILAGVVGGILAAHRERISSLEKEVQQLKWATDLNEAKLDHLLEGTELAKRLTESEGPIRVANVTLMDNVVIELREVLDRYLSSRGLEKEGPK
jgi:hypothetical protein